MDSIANRKNLKLGEKPMWRSLDELAQTDEFREMLEREFPDAASEWDDSSSRRTFLKVMGASLALAGVGVGGCVKPSNEKIVPYVRQPEEVIPGKPLYFASACTLNGYARGIVVESHEGRPTKIEGNEKHPASLGAADAITQAHILNLYDPDRAQVVNYAGEVSNWNNFTRAMQTDLDARKSTGGEGIRLLTGNITSPTLAAQITAFLTAYPKAHWHQYEALNTDNQKQGLQQAFGKMVQPVYHFEKAKVIVSLDDNFLSDHVGSVRYARDCIDGRRVRREKREMNRLYVAETTPSITGAMADERVRVKPSEIVNIARSIQAGDGATPFLKAIAEDLEKNHGASLVVAGDSQPAEVHAIAAALNSKLGSIGKTVDYIEPVEADPKLHVDSLRQLVADMDGKQVDLLIIIGQNPAFDAPADFNFADKLKSFSTTLGKRSVHMSMYYDETSYNCQWHLPLAHELEVWSDARAYDGTASIMQPLIAALYQGKSAHVLLSIMLGGPTRGGYELVRDYWRGVTSANSAGGDFDSQWIQWLSDGVIPNTAAKPINVNLAANASAAGAAVSSAGGMEIAFRPDPFIWDGRFANNGWLMEVPRPLTKMTWDNAVLMSPATAAKLNLAQPNDYNSKPQSPIVDLTVNNQHTSGPIWIVPGHPDDCVSVYMGFGRERAGRVGGNIHERPPVEKRGFNVYPIRSSGAMWSAGVDIKSTGETMLVACTQTRSGMINIEARELLKIIPIKGESHGEHGEPHAEHGHRTVSLNLYPPRQPGYPDDVRKGNKWGMVIDQNACTGCTACVVACQAENNIAVVGKDQVSRGRELHWLRIDTYYEGDPQKPEELEGPYFQPVACQHCENAPCELVCPANATSHDIEGTNNMVYNRCIGTRYCSNNCPYKVRRFNFMRYSDEWLGTEVQKMVMNPNVTVRSIGVMEKCSYCIQRINSARINAKKEFADGKRTEDALADGEVVTACQQSCPTQAIYFGNLNDKDFSNNGKGSVVRMMLEEEGNYALLDEELQTLPRTSYLPRYTNRAEKA